MVQVINQPRTGAKEPQLCIASASLLRRYRKEETEKETMAARLQELETELNNFIKSVLKSQLKPEESDEIANLSRDSLNNIAVIKRISEQLQEADTEE